MLITLSIENFAIVKQLELDFSQGMTTFTGETGAGKSIMIDALMLALGGRADASVVRSGEEKCEVSAVFLIEPNSEPAQWLSDHDLTCTDAEVILRRVIYTEGRSKSSINGQPFPLQKIKELSEMLVHIHGQHQHQTLMQHSTHRQQLDRFAGHDDLLLEVHRLYKQCTKIKQDLEQLSRQEIQRDRLNLLEFQIDELAALNVHEGELQRLHEEHQLLHHAKDYLLSTQQLMALLNGEDEPNLSQGLNQVLHLLKELPQESAPIKNAFELLNSALIQCEESIDEVEKFADQIQLDPERLHEVEERMSAIHQAARKYQIDANQLPQHLHQLQSNLDQLKNAEHEMSELEHLYAEQKKQYETSAIKLRESRQSHAKNLEKDLTSRLQQLGMPKGYVVLDFAPLDKMQAHGLDKVEYKVCTNPGTSPDALAKIASGGELSRISLAIQMITAQRGATPTLLFDEVDVGIGGATAALVGQLLRKLGERLQVFCVTHQPQVASSAHHHFLVEKQSDNEQTFTSIFYLKEHEKIDEIARMLGGLTVTDQTRSHAKELIAQSA